MRSEAKHLYLRATNNLQDSSLSAAPQNDTLAGFFNKLLRPPTTFLLIERQKLRQVSFLISHKHRKGGWSHLSRV
jgi:hypothetical protein